MNCVEITSFLHLQFGKQFQINPSFYCCPPPHQPHSNMINSLPYLSDLTEVTITLKTQEELIKHTAKACFTL